MNNLFTGLTSIAIALGTVSCSKSSATRIQNQGSDTMLEVAQAWAESYYKVNPKVGVAISGGGSSNGISGIISGTVDIANCSRAMRESELDKAAQQGNKPVQHKVGYDGIAIYVHKDNPIESISLEQLRQIFGDVASAVTRWSELGVKMPDGVDDKILRVSRQSNSGTYEYFRTAVLGKTTNFRIGASALNGSKDVVDQVSNSRPAIGYSGLAYATDEVRMLPVTAESGATAVAPSIPSVLDGSYPISRPLFMYTIGPPQGAVKDYLDWIKSDDGQRILRDRGYPPLRELGS